MKQLRQQVENCQKCSLSQNRLKAVFGQVIKGSQMLLVGEAPGYHEDMTGKPFVGRSGQALNKKLIKHEFDRSKLSVINVVCCRPPENRVPTKFEIETCREYLEKKVDYVKPSVIVALGKTATWALLFPNKEINQIPSLTELFDTVYKCRVLEKEYPLIIIYHPSYWLRNFARADIMVDRQFRLIKKVLDGNTGESKTNIQKEPN